MNTPPPSPIITPEMLPPDIIFILGVILVGGLALFVLIPMFISYWRLTQTSLLATHEVYERNGGGKKAQEALGILLGLLVLDAALYLLNNKVLSLPTTLFYPLLAIINGLMLFFALDGLLVMGILKARKYYLERRMYRINRSRTDF